MNRVVYVKVQHKAVIPTEDVCPHTGADRYLLFRSSWGPCVRLLCTGLKKGRWCMDALQAGRGGVCLLSCI